MITHLIINIPTFFRKKSGGNDVILVQYPFKKMVIYPFK